MTGKKVVGVKNDFSKSCPKFCKLGEEFFYFDEISKMRLLFDYVYHIHKKSCIFSPGATKNQNYDEKFYRHAHMA